jgi:hypothetical protein
MDEAIMIMDKTTHRKPMVFREQQFRAPSKSEYAMGLWVDRIGQHAVSVKQERLRILGQYCYIQVLKGAGVYISKTVGKIPVKAGDCMIQFPEDPCTYYPHDAWATCWVTWNGSEGKTLEGLGYMNPRRPVFADPGGSVLRAFIMRMPPRFSVARPSPWRWWSNPSPLHTKPPAKGISRC